MEDIFSVDNVTEANERFYRALENTDLFAMSDVWLHADWVKCVHPGWDLITGWDDIRESWDRIFQNTSGMRVSSTDVQVRVENDLALVSCYEKLALFVDNTSAPISAHTTATNLFQRIEDKWLMIHHHASQIPGKKSVTQSDMIQ